MTRLPGGRQATISRRRGTFGPPGHSVDYPAHIIAAAYTHAGTTHEAFKPELAKEQTA